VPGLPGFGFEGETEAEAAENVDAAIEEYLAARGEPVRGAEMREVELRVLP
jgi:predicted RNase H-like HicB family nuclease